MNEQELLHELHDLFGWELSDDEALDAFIRSLPLFEWVPRHSSVVACAEEHDDVQALHQDLSVGLINLTEHYAMTTYALDWERVHKLAGVDRYWKLPGKWFKRALINVGCSEVGAKAVVDLLREGQREIEKKSGRPACVNRVDVKTHRVYWVDDFAAMGKSACEERLVHAIFGHAAC